MIVVAADGDSEGSYGSSYCDNHINDKESNHDSL